jgi:3-phosphoshikimate 1-carboxyvinyltransferase
LKIILNLGILKSMDVATKTTGADELISGKPSALRGTVRVPGDKSISHRSLILGGLAIGKTKVTGLLAGDDVMATANAMRALGVPITQSDEGVWHITGVGLQGLISPERPLDLGNSGTGVRLLMGVVAGQPITATFTGDASLSVRPMARITEPLAKMGAKITSRDGGLLPVTITGSETPLAADHVSTVASAQIKSAVLLAGLNARGTTVVTEPHASRDHSESMLRHFGADVIQTVSADGVHRVELTGESELTAADIIVPSDPSSAAFIMVAALITPDSDVTIPAVGMNPLRTGLITTLTEMGGAITISNERVEGGEQVADIRVCHSQLKGIAVPAERAASMIDEYPILSVAAAVASGITTMQGVAELRVKETDRIKVMADGLALAGVTVAYDDDTMTVTGGPIAGGVTIASQHDHRIAMSFLTLGMVADSPVTVTGCLTINTSFPGFADLVNGCGASIAATSTR